MLFHEAQDLARKEIERWGYPVDRHSQYLEMESNPPAMYAFRVEGHRERMLFKVYEGDFVVRTEYVLKKGHPPLNRQHATLYPWGTQYDREGLILNEEGGETEWS